METVPASDFNADLLHASEQAAALGINTAQAATAAVGSAAHYEAELNEKSFRDAYNSFAALRRLNRAMEGAPASSDTPFFFRALNSDNHVDALRVVRLFRAHYGGDHPLKRVYETDFWSVNVASRTSSAGMVSLVAVQGEEFIAHLAYDCSPESGVAQILLPAIHPDHRLKLFPLIREFWQRMTQTAMRQSWRLVFTYNLTSQPLLQLLAAKCFRCEAAALLPSGVAPAGDGEKQTAETALNHSCVLVMCNVLQFDPADRRVLYPPVRHAAKIKQIFESLRLPRSFGADDSAHRTTDVQQLALFHREAHTLQDSEKAVSLQVLKGLGVYLLQIHSPGLAVPEAALSTIRRLERAPKFRQRTVVVRVPLDDARCPAFCERLEGLGLKFCGVFPLMDGHDCVGYTRLDEGRLRRLTLYTEASKKLRDYMLQD